MKRSPIKRTQISRRPSSKQRKELAERSKLKKTLLEEGPHDEAGNPLCNHCKKLPDFRGLQLVHLKSIGMGGRKGMTTRENCEVWCAPCHFGADGHNTE